MEMVIKDYLKQHIEQPEVYTLGPNIYSHWRILLGKPSSTTGSALLVKSKKDIVPTSLERAGKELSKRGGRHKFVQAMEQIKDDDINQRVVKGILAGFLSISSSASAQQLNCAVAIIRWVEKKAIKEKFPEEFEAVRGHINEVLCSVIWGSKLS